MDPMPFPRRPSAVLYWVLLAGYAGLIFWLSSLGSDELPALFGRVWDKLLHAGSFALLGLLFLLAVSSGVRRPNGPGKIAATLLFVLGYGLVDEWHQYGVATRTASATDLLADLVGGAAGVLAYRLLAGFRRRAQAAGTCDHS
jgi:VanZ family protein